MSASFTTANRLAELLGDWRQGGPAHERLAATVRSLILDGRIPLQSRLPPERALAGAVGCSRATVTFAYNRLREEGYIESRQGAGSWVALPAGHRAATDTLLAGAGLEMRIAALPAPPALDDIARAAVGDLPRWLDHHGYDPLGLPPLREAIAARYTARGLPTRPEQIIVTNGALQAIDLTIRAVLRRAQKVLVEIPSYPAALDALRAAGARPVAVPVGASGWDLGMLQALAREQEPALAYLIPDHQNPTGAVMDAPSRRRALQDLERAGSHVVIDETFSELWLDGPATAPPAPVAGERTIIVGSLGKSVWGGLRIGWARAEPVLIGRLAMARATTDMASPVLEQIIATHVLRELDAIMAERRVLIRVRRGGACGCARDNPSRVALLDAHRRPVHLGRASRRDQHQPGRACGGARRADHARPALRASRAARALCPTAVCACARAARTSGGDPRAGRPRRDVGESTRAAVDLRSVNPARAGR